MIRNWPDGFISGDDLPPRHERGGIVLYKAVCPGCLDEYGLNAQDDARWERHWIGGMGYQKIIACDTCRRWFKKRSP